MGFDILYKEKENNTCTKNLIKDLRIDYIINGILSSQNNFNIEDYFYCPLKLKQNIDYRQEIFKDLLNSYNYDTFNYFSNVIFKQYKDFNNCLKISYKNQRYIKLFNLSCEYINILNDILNRISKIELNSIGLIGIKNLLNTILLSDYYNELSIEANEIRNSFSEIKFIMSLNNGEVKVDKYKETESLYKRTKEIIERFDFNKSTSFSFPNEKPSLDIDNLILDYLESKYRKEFNKLESFFNKFKDYFNMELYKIANDIQFYLLYLKYIQRFNQSHLQFCVPKINYNNQQCKIINGYDLALADAFIYEGKTVVTNDFYLNKDESVVIISGPNQGGKSTYAKFIGQCFYLASLGGLIPGDYAELFLCSSINSIFSLKEESTNLNGKLKTELMLLNNYINEMGYNGVLILNEVFSSTVIEDGLLLAGKIIDIINKKGIVSIFVTFLDEIADYNDTVVSMESVVDKENPAIRTFKVIRKSQDKIAYARAIAEKNKVTYEDIVEVIKNDN